MNNNHTIIPLSLIDQALIEDLLDLAFEPERQQRTAYKIRKGVDFLPGLSFAAIDDHEKMIGTIQCWPIALITPQKQPYPMLMIGPVAVLPKHQGKGCGKSLMMALISSLSANALLPQVMIGDPEYYGRFWNFSNIPTRRWQLPGPYDPDRLLVRCDNSVILPTQGILGPWPR